MPFINQPKSSSTFNTGLGYLLTELSGFLLQENGGRIILEESTNIKAMGNLSNQFKNSGGWTNQEKSV